MEKSEVIKSWLALVQNLKHALDSKHVLADIQHLWQEENCVHLISKIFLQI